MDEILAREVLFDITDIFESFRIQYFLVKGACLGAYREKGLIAWDDDVDLFTKAEEFIPKIQLIAKAITDKGYKLVQRAKPFVRINRFAAYKRGFHLDTNALFLIDDKRWVVGPKGDLVFPACFFDNPEQIDLLGREFNVPTPVTEYLEWNYGLDYMVPLKRPTKREDLPDKMFGTLDRNRVPEELK